jgi:hypothetical protein
MGKSSEMTCLLVGEQILSRSESIRAFDDAANLPHRPVVRILPVW